MKTICFDLRALQIGHQNRGIGMYIKSVIEHLSDDENEYIFYCFDKNNPIADLGINTRVKYAIVTTPTINTVLDSPKNIFGIFKLVGHRFKPLESFRPDVFVQFDFMLGIPSWRRTKKIIIGYDLIPLIMRNEYMPSIHYAWHHSHGKKAKLKGVLRSMYYRFRYHLHYKSYKRADKVICISQASADSFHELLGISSKKLVPIPLAPVLPEGAVDSKIARSIDKPYLFYIGGTDSRKRVQDIIYAYNIIRSRGFDAALVLAGNEFKTIDQIPDIKSRNALLRSPYKHDVHLIGFVTDPEKMGLYQHASAFVFTSSFEGFGLPVIEAMAASCPVITYNNSSIPEAAGDAAVMVKTGDFISIANEFIGLNDPKKRSTLIQAGVKQSQRFTWEAYVKGFRDNL